MATPNKDAEYLVRLRDYYADNRRIPSFKRIAELMGFSSRMSSDRLLQRLASAGYIVRTPDDEAWIPSGRFFEHPLAGVSIRAGSPDMVEARGPTFRRRSAADAEPKQLRRNGMRGFGPDKTTSTDKDRPDSLRVRQRTLARESLLKAAKKVFEEKGFLKTRVSDIAARAGVSHGHFYNYFDSKNAIFRELARDVDQKLIDSQDVFHDQTSAATPQERMKMAIRVNFERFQSEARIIGIIEEVSHYDQDVDDIRRVLHKKDSIRLARTIREMQQEGKADPRLDPTIASAALGAMSWRFAERWFLRGELTCSFDEGVEQYTLLVMNALQFMVGVDSK